MVKNAASVFQGVDNGPHQPQRKCVVSRHILPKADLLRFVCKEDNSLEWDASGKQTGRGLWMTAGFGSFTTKQLVKGFSHAARAKVEIPDDLHDLVEKGLSARIEKVLMQAKCGRHGALYVDEENSVHSFEEALENKEIGLVIYAKDKRPVSCEKIKELSQTGEAKLAECDGVFFGAELCGWAWVALKKGPHATRVWEDCRRLQALRTSLLMHNAGNSSNKSMD